MLRSLGCDRLQLTQVLVNFKPGPYHETPVEAGVKARLAKSYQKQHAGQSQKSSAERKMPCETKRKKSKTSLWLVGVVATHKFKALMQVSKHESM